MAIDWPDDVNQDALAKPGVTEELIDNKLSFAPERGMALERLATAMTLSKLTFDMMVTEDEWVALEAWFRDTLFDGIEEFDRLHPAGLGTAISCVFAAPLRRLAMYPTLHRVPISLLRVA